MYVEVFFFWVSISVSVCVCDIASVRGQDQLSKSTLERVAQSNSPTHLSPSLCLSHLTNVPLLPVHGKLKSSQN